MQKLRKYLIISLIIISTSFILFNSKKEYLSEDNVLGIYVNNELSDNYPSKDSAMFQKAVCDDSNTKVTWDNDNWGLLISNLNKKVKCNLYFYSGETVFNFEHTGSEQTFIAPVSGTYRLETWGAQGGSYNGVYGGYGGYSSGDIILNKGNSIYINVGGTTNGNKGGYNGGGNGSSQIVESEYMINKYLGGGGATHISTSSGLLSKLENKLENILITSGAGGGAYYYSDHIFYKINGGHAGGYIGNNGNAKIEINDSDIPATGGTQNFGGLGNNSNAIYSGSFGQGGNGSNVNLGLGTGGGSGFYGGGGTYNVGSSSESGGGGSGYIGNPLLTNKVMYCYNCEESNEESTKTISTTCSEETPTSNCAKKGNGYARITLVSIDE